MSKARLRARQWLTWTRFVSYIDLLGRDRRAFGWRWLVELPSARTSGGLRALLSCRDHRRSRLFSQQTGGDRPRQGTAPPAQTLQLAGNVLGGSPFPTTPPPH